MLRVCDYVDSKSVHFEYDCYVPLHVEFGVWNSLLDPTVSLIFEPDNKSVLEIGFGKKHKVVRYLTVTCCNRDMVYHDERPFICPQETTFGCPVLDVPDIAEGVYYIKEDSLFEVYLSNNNVRISFSKNEVAKSIKNDKVEFLIDESRNLIDVLVSDIDEKSMMIIKSALL